MPKIESVLISVSIVVTAPVSELPEDALLDSVQEAFLDAVAERLRSGVAAMENEPWLELNAGVSFHYLSPQNEFSEKNVGRCAECGRWTSDCDAPDFLIMLGVGRTIDGRLVCDECAICGATSADAACKSIE